MTLAATIFTLVAAIALLMLPRKWAALPLLIGACYMTLGQGIEIGPFSFTVIRLLIAAGLARVMIRGERPSGGWNRLDKLMPAWSIWLIISSFFHEMPVDTLIFSFGRIYNTVGIYFLIRCFSQTRDDLIGIVKMIAILLVPVALEMLSEQFTHRNLFSVFGGVPEQPSIRNGRLRSQGPFAISILSGTVGATCAPIMLGLWSIHKRLAILGLSACILIVLSSASSGPVMSLLFSVFALAVWPWRHLTGHMRMAAVAFYILLELVMKAPAYYLIARIDIAGGSTGYHRAALIQSAITYFNEWWFAGTDYTRHWMAYGVTWSENHADITNHYLAQGVRGGFLLMLIFMMSMWYGFKNIGDTLREDPLAPKDYQFFVWTVGASLFAHAMSCVSIAYFDQSFVFLYFTLAATAALKSYTVSSPWSEPIVESESALLHAEEPVA